MLRFLKNYRLALLWAGFIAFLCGLPGKDIPHISFLELLSFDKWVHASVFFVLVLFLSKAYRLADIEFFRHHANKIALLLAIAYGGLLEILQAILFIDRSADLYDFIANSFGAAMAIWWLHNKASRQIKKV